MESCLFFHVLGYLKSCCQILCCRMLPVLRNNHSSGIRPPITPIIPITPINPPTK